MSLYLVQHGKSLPKEIDPDSPLSEEGETTVRRTAKAAGEYLVANVKPPKPTLNALKIAAPLVLAIFLWITVCGEAQGGTLYEYTDKDGAVVITDRPPPGVKATPKASYPPITEEQKSALERKKAEQLQQNPKGDEAKKEKQKKSEPPEQN